MKSLNIKSPPENYNRLGFHYFPDTLHYSENELEKWLPVLQRIKADWLVLEAGLHSAIPECFITGLINSGISPIIRCHLPLETVSIPDDLKMLIHTYGNWGVTKMLFHDRPNQKSSWPQGQWPQHNLIENYVSLFLSIASTCEEENIVSIFPPLEPGGDYWDTVFLEACLTDIFAHAPATIKSHLTISNYGYLNNRPKTWGAGGNRQWPMVKPYHVPQDSEDQRGFHISDWYQEISEKVTGSRLPIIMFEAGRNNNILNLRKTIVSDINIPEVLIDAIYERGENAALPDSVLGACIWLLSAEPQSTYADQAWWNSDGTPSHGIQNLFKNLDCVSSKQENATTPSMKVVGKKSTSFAHYLLLPTFDWGVADWYLDAARPFIKKYQPTIGFSIEDALQAERVTVLGSEEIFPDDLLIQFRQTGALVERIQDDGISLATQLIER